MAANEELSETAKNVIARLEADWNFEGDCMILQWMEQISQNLETKAKHTLASLDALNNNINRIQIDLENTQNNFTALQYSQYVEMRCQDDSMPDSPIEKATTGLEHAQQEKPAAANRQEILQTFLENNIKMLKNCHDRFNFLEDSDEDEDSNGAALAENCIYQPRNPYNERLLPHIYGTKMWQAHSHVGLEDDEEKLDEASDEKSEVYSISSTASSSSLSRERESLESRNTTTANNSQWTSSASLSNDFQEISKPLKLPTSSISNTTSLASLPTVATTISTSVVEAKSNEAANEADLPSASPSLKTSKQQPILNLFDDNDYQKLVAEVKQKTQNLASSNEVVQPTAVKPLPQMETLPKIPTKNLFDSPTEDLFADLPITTSITQRAEKNDFFKTKLSSKNLFDDDDDDLGADFLNSASKKPTKSTDDSAPLFDEGRDELDRQAKSVEQQKTEKIVPAVKPQKSRFFDDDDDGADFFGKLQENLPQKFTEKIQNVVKEKVEPAIKPKGALFFDDNDDEQDFFENLQVKSPPKTQTLSQTVPFLSDEPPLDFDDVIEHQHKAAQVKQYAKKQEILPDIKSKASLFFDDDDEEQDFLEKLPQKSITIIPTSSPVVPPLDLGDKKENHNEATKQKSFEIEAEVDDFLEMGGSKQPKSQTFEKTNLFADKDDVPDELTATIEATALPTQSEIQISNMPKANFVVQDNKVDFEHDWDMKTNNDASNKNDDNEQLQNIDTKAVEEPSILQQALQISSPQSAYAASAGSTEPPLDEHQATAAVKPSADFSFGNAVDEDDDDDFLSIFKNKKSTMVAPKTTDPKVYKEFQNAEVANTANEQQPQQAFNETSKESTTENAPAEPEESTTNPTNNAHQATNSLNSTNNSESPKETSHVIENQAKQQKSLFDHFSHLFLDEPPDDDDDDFLQTISSSSSSQVLQNNSSYGIDNDFYEPSKSNLDTSTKIADSKQQQQDAQRTGYSIQLFDEMPPEDNLTDLFAKNENESTPPDVEQTGKPAEKPAKIERSFSAAAAATETTTAKPIAKFKLPKIDINVQALLPNAGKSLIKPKGKVEEIANDVAVAAKTTKPALPATQPTAKSYEQQPENAHLLPSLCKSRVRGPVKRKSSTRAGRQESYQQSLKIEAENSNVEAEIKEKTTTATTKIENEKQQQPAAPKALPIIQVIASKPAHQAAQLIPAPALSTQATTVTEKPATLPPASIATRNSATKIAPAHMENLMPKQLEPSQKLAPRLSESAIPQQSPSSSSALKQSAKPQTTLPTIKAAKIFFDSDSENDDDADFFGKLAQPQLTATAASAKTLLTSKPLTVDDDDADFYGKLAQPQLPATAPNTKSLLTSKPSTVDDGDDDDDLFGSNIAKIETKSTTTKTNLGAVPKPKDTVVVKPLRPTALFDSNEEDSADDLFKPSSKSLTPSTRQLTNPPASTNAAIQKLPAPITSRGLFSDSDDDDDDLFGSGASKSSRVSAAQLTKAPQKQPELAKKPTQNTADNPLADLLN